VRGFRGSTSSKASLVEDLDSEPMTPNIDLLVESRSRVFPFLTALRVVEDLDSEPMTPNIDLLVDVYWRRFGSPASSPPTG
jgi:hypothetical protein